MSAGEQQVEGLQRPKVQGAGADSVVAGGMLQGGREGQEPDRADVEAGDMVEPLGNPCQGALRVALLETVWGDLVEDRGLPPGSAS